MPFASIPETPPTAHALLVALDRTLRGTRLDRLALACAPEVMIAAAIAGWWLHLPSLAEQCADSGAPPWVCTLPYANMVKGLAFTSLVGALVRAWTSPTLVAGYNAKQGLSLPISVCVPRGLTAWLARALCGLPTLVPLAMLAMCAAGPFDAIEPIVDERFVQLTVGAACAMLVGWLIVVAPVYLVLPSLASLEHGTVLLFIRRGFRLVRGSRAAVGVGMAVVLTTSFISFIGFLLLTGPNPTLAAISLGVALALTGCTAAVMGPTVYAWLRDSSCA